MSDPLANIDGFSDKTLDDCYGIVDSSGGVPDAGRQLHGSNVVHQNIIKRFNQVKAIDFFSDKLEKKTNLSITFIVLEKVFVFLVVFSLGIFKDPKSFFRRFCIKFFVALI